MSQDIMSRNDENDLRWGKLAQRYEELSIKLKMQSELEEIRHQELLASMERTNAKILESASNLAYHPPVENTEPNISPSELRRARRELDKQKTSEFDPLRYWIVSKKGL